MADGFRGFRPLVGAVTGRAGGDRGWRGLFFFSRVVANAPGFVLQQNPEFPFGALGKAEPDGGITSAAHAGFISPTRRFISISGVEATVSIDLGSVSVGALGKAAPTGETIETNDIFLGLPVEVFSLGRSAVAATITHDGPVAHALGSVTVGALGKSGVIASITNYAFSIGSVSINAKGLGALVGDVFEPQVFNLGLLSLPSRGYGGLFALALGQPAQADFENLPFGSYGVATTTIIWNMALSHIGVKRMVQSETERSQEASVLSLHWAPAVNKVLADHPWQFARKYAQLGLVTADPNDDWNFAYRYPADCVFTRRLVTKTGGRTDPNPPQFVIGQDNWGRLIFTDEPDAVLEYTMRVFEPERYDPQFVVMLSWYLAHLIANSLSRIAGASKQCYDMYETMLAKATTTSSNEIQQEDPQEAEWIRERV